MLETNASSGQAIDIGRLHHRVAVRPQVAIHIVGSDEQNIGAIAAL